MRDISFTRCQKLIAKLTNRNFSTLSWQETSSWGTLQSYLYSVLLKYNQRTNRPDLAISNANGSTKMICNALQNLHLQKLRKRGQTMSQMIRNFKSWTTSDRHCKIKRKLREIWRILVKFCLCLIKIELRCYCRQVMIACTNMVINLMYAGVFLMKHWPLPAS